MKTILLSSAITSGLAALTIGLAAPALATPSIDNLDQAGITLSAAPHEFPRIQNNTEKVDKRDKQRFNTTVNRPIYTR